MSSFRATLWAGLLASSATVALGAGAANAAGFQVMEQSARAQGYSFAGATAAAEDISYMYFNPAAIAYHPGTNNSLNASLILPRGNIDDAEGFTVLGTPISGDSDNTNEFAAVPATYVSAQLHEKWFAGLSITSPFGLVTDFQDEWVGRYHATRSELLSINASPTIAFRPIPQVALAGGFVIEYVDASLGNAVDLGTAGVLDPSVGAAFTAVGATPTPGGNDIDADVHGDDFDFGFTLGALIEPVKGTRFGIGFRSEIEHEVDLQSDFKPNGAVSAAVLNALQFNGAFTPGTASTVVAAPAQVNLGVYHELNEKWALVADARWTDWSSFEELVIEFEDGTPTSVTEQNWNDTWFFAVGAKYQFDDNLAFRTGIAYDLGAAPDENRTPRIPDADRAWVSIGATYDITDKVALNAGYSYVYVRDEDINLTAEGDNVGRGSLTANTRADVHIFAVSGTLRF